MLNRFYYFLLIFILCFISGCINKSKMYECCYQQIINHDQDFIISVKLNHIDKLIHDSITYEVSLTNVSGKPIYIINSDILLLRSYSKHNYGLILSLTGVSSGGIEYGINIRRINSMHTVFYKNKINFDWFKNCVEYANSKIIEKPKRKSFQTSFELSYISDFNEIIKYRHLSGGHNPYIDSDSLTISNIVFEAAAKNKKIDGININIE